MRLFIFYTAEGYTEDPNGNEVHNCQMLGVASGNGIVSARDNLLKENDWIIQDGFSVSGIMGRELLNDKMY